jgi:hypothetical protein
MYRFCRLGFCAQLSLLLPPPLGPTNSCTWQPHLWVAAHIARCMQRRGEPLKMPPFLRMQPWKGVTTPGRHFWTRAPPNACRPPSPPSPEPNPLRGRGGLLSVGQSASRPRATSHSHPISLTTGPLQSGLPPTDYDLSSTRHAIIAHTMHIS